MASVVFSSIQDGTPWLSGWTYRRMIVIPPQIIQTDLDRFSAPGANLTDFPVPIYCNAASGRNNIDATSIFDLLGSESLKIAVTGSDGVTEQKVEVAVWDDNNEILELFVKHTIDYTDYNILWLYYDPDHADNTTNVGVVGSANGIAVWSTAIWSAVYHLGEDPSGGAGSILDSLGNLDGTPANMAAGNSVIHNGITMGLTFDGIEELVSMGDDDAFSFDNAGNDEPFSIDVFATIDEATQAKLVVKRGDTPAGNILEYLFQLDASDRQLFNIYDDADNARIGKFRSSASTGDEGDPNHWGGTYDGSNLNTGINIYFDGLIRTMTANNSGTYNGMQNTAGTFKVGGDLDSEDWFEGTISEVRLAKVELTAHWQRATALSLQDQLLFIGEQETVITATFGQRIEMTIAAADIDAAQTDFPLPIKLGIAVGIGADDVSAIFDEVGADFLKIAITDESGQQLNVQVISWDEVAETALLHVKVPSISSTVDTILYFYYDALYSNNHEFVGSSRSAPAIMVWDLDFALVCGFNESPAASDLLDYTAHLRDGTPAGSMDGSDLIAGYWGNAWAFDAVDDIISWSDILDFDGDDLLTLEAIFRSSASGTAANILSKQEDAGDFQGWFFSLRAGSSYELAFDIDGGVNRYFATGATGSLNDGSWHQGGLTWDGVDAASMIIVVDGADDTDTPVANTDPGATTNVTEPLNLHGKNDGADDGAFDYEMIRISNADRGLEWLNASWEAFGDNLITYSAEQTDWVDGIINVLVTLHTLPNLAFANTIDVNVALQAVFFAGLPILLNPVGSLSVKVKAWNLGVIGLLTDLTVAGNKPRVSTVTGSKPEVT